MNINADIPVCDGSATIDPTFHINNLTRVLLNDYGTSNVSKNKDTNILKHNSDTPSRSQDHPRQASPHNEDNNTDLTIFHQNIRGLYNKKIN